MKRLFAVLALVLCSTVPLSRAQLLMPSYQVSAKTNNFDYIPTTNVTAQMIFDWLDDYLRTSTNGLATLLPANTYLQTWLTAIDDALSLETNAWSHIAPSNRTIQAAINWIDANIAGRTNAWQIKIETNNFQTILGFPSGSNSVQQAMDIVDNWMTSNGVQEAIDASNHVTQAQLRQFITAPSNRYFISDTYSSTGFVTNAEHLPGAAPLQLEAEAQSTSNLFIDTHTAGKTILTPRYEGLYYAIDMAANFTTTDATKLDEATQFGVFSTNVVTGAVGDWLDLRPFTRSGPARCQLHVVTSLSTNDRLYVHVHNTATNTACSSWAMYIKAIGTTTTNTP